MQFPSDVMAGDPITILILVIGIAVVAYLFPSAVQRARDRAAIATYKLEERHADKDIHPTVIPQINLMEAKARVELQYAERRRDIGLEGGQRAELTDVYKLEEIKNRLFKIYEDWNLVQNGRDPQQVKSSKVALLQKQAKSLEEQFYGRREPDVVSDSNGQVVRPDDEDDNSGGSSSPGAQATTNQVPVEKTRVGF